MYHALLNVTQHRTWKRIVHFRAGYQKKKKLTIYLIYIVIDLL